MCLFAAETLGSRRALVWWGSRGRGRGQVFSFLIISLQKLLIPTRTAVLEANAGLVEDISKLMHLGLALLSVPLGKTWSKERKGRQTDMIVS